MSASTNVRLKEQFDQLQNQQQKKLMLRKQLKESKEKKSVTNATEQSTMFGVTDELDLQLDDSPEVKDSIYSEELVNHLGDQLREMKDENGRLYKLLSEKDLEVRHLRKKRESDQAALVGGMSSVTNENAATKIVELSKKIRELTSELESEKTKTKQYVKKSQDLENELRLVSDGLAPSSKTSGNSTARSSVLSGQRSAEGDMEMKALQDRLKQTDLKLAEQRNNLQAVKQELKMAQKVISQECGEGVTMQSLLNNTSGWRGRAQQLVALQKKVNELRVTVERYQRAGAPMADDMDDTVSLASSTRRPDTKYSSEQRRMEKERRETQERQAADLKALEADHETVKQKLDASKARIKVLSGEIKSLKQQMQTLLEKGRHDDELIEALFKQQAQLKSSLDDTSRQKEMVENKKIESEKQLAQRSQQEGNVVEQLQGIVAERQAKVEMLERELENIKAQKVQAVGMSALFDQRDSRPSSAVTETQSESSPDLEIQHPQRNTSANSRTSSQAASSQSIQAPDKWADQRAPSRTSGCDSASGDRPASGRRSASHRPNSAEVNENKELRRQWQESHTLCQAAEVEKDKLSELVQLLQQRIDQANKQVLDSQNDLQLQRRKNAELEKQLGKARVEQAQSAKKSKTKLNLRASAADLSSIDDGMNGDGNLEEMQTRLAIQQDENEALKAALQSTLTAKEQDMKLYGQMMEETKKVFLQGLRQYRQSGNT